MRGRAETQATGETPGRDGDRGCRGEGRSLGGRPDWESSTQMARKMEIARERAQDGGRLARDAKREEGVGQRQGQERDPAGAPR
jgi:hypothetical protein